MDNLKNTKIFKRAISLILCIGIYKWGSNDLVLAPFVLYTLE